MQQFSQKTTFKLVKKFRKIKKINDFQIKETNDQNQKPAKTKRKKDIQATNLQLILLQLDLLTKRTTKQTFASN